MGDDKQGLEISLPGEWALKKTLGPVLGEIGDDLSRLYSTGRDKIAEVALRKIKDPNDGASANLRVARDVFWNGSYTDESICAEYFGGILAASRSKDGRDDTGVFFVDIIKSLSSGQLKLHYIFYRTLNKFFLSRDKYKTINPGQRSELQGIRVYLTFTNIVEQLNNEDLGAVLHGLSSKGLIESFQTNNYELEDGSILPNIFFVPTTLGIQLFAIANNMFSEWRKFSITDFGDFPDVQLPNYYSDSLTEILKEADLK